MRFLLTTLVFLLDPKPQSFWEAKLCATVIFPRFPVSLSRVMESIKVGSTLRLKAGRKESGLLRPSRFFDRTLRSVKEYNAKVEYIPLNLVAAGLVTHAEGWPWSSVHDYTGDLNTAVSANYVLAIDRVLLPADERARI